MSSSDSELAAFIRGWAKVEYQDGNLEGCRLLLDVLERAEREGILPTPSG